MKSLRSLAAFVKEHKLSIFIWPEGTRSRSGRLQRFKKGAVHLAIQTGLPVVPLVVSGAHKTWEKSGMRIRPAPIRVDVLPAIDTSEWSSQEMNEHLEELHAAFREVLPSDQLPEDEAQAA